LTFIRWLVMTRDKDEKNQMRQFISKTPEDTYRFGFAIGQVAKPGTVVALSGDLGAGKTVLAKGVGAGLGVTSIVKSPTFVILQQHEGGRLPFWHADLYRLGDESELEELGLEEAMEDGVLVVEWAERFAEALPQEAILKVQIEHQNGDARQIQFEGHGEAHALLETRLG